MGWWSKIDCAHNLLDGLVEQERMCSQPAGWADGTRQTVLTTCWMGWWSKIDCAHNLLDGLVEQDRLCSQPAGWASGAR